MTSTGMIEKNETENTHTNGGNYKKDHKTTAHGSRFKIMYEKSTDYDDLASQKISRIQKNS